MSENQSPPSDGGVPSAPSQDDRIKNLQAEFSRKLDNQAAQLQSLVQQLQQQNRPAQPPSKKMSELIFEDADAAANEIEERAARRAEAKIEARMHQQQMVGQLYNDYPELNDPQSDFAKAANERFMQLPEAERANPVMMRLAVKEAAAELGLKPKRLRDQTSTSDNFSLPAGKPSASGSSKRRDSDLSPETLEFAQLLGLDTNDPKVVERLAERAKRKNWKQYS